jgi:hypothetical protein
VMDEICEYMTCQCAVYIGGHFILQGERHDKSQGREPLPAASGAKTRAGCACRGDVAAPPAPRTLLSVVSRCCPEFAYYQGYLPVKQTGDAYVKVEYRLFFKGGAGQSCRR